VISNAYGEAPISSPYRTVGEAAEYLRMSPQTLNNHRCKGTGPSYHKHGRRVLYHIDALIGWSNLHKIELQSPQGEFAF